MDHLEDELNIINLASKNDLNYGWPINLWRTYWYEGSENLKSELYKAPCKVRIDYGFIEPIKQWTPALGVSKVLSIKNFFDNNNLILVSALETTLIIDRSVHLHFDKNYEKILNKEILKKRE